MKQYTIEDIYHQIPAELPKTPKPEQEETKKLVESNQVSNFDIAKQKNFYLKFFCSKLLTGFIN